MTAAVPAPSPWRTSLPTKTAREFLNGLRDRGWNPEEALMAYQEWRKMATPRIWRADPPPFPQTKKEAAHRRDCLKVEAARVRLQNCLEQMAAPEDWDRYKTHWAGIALGGGI